MPEWVGLATDSLEFIVPWMLKLGFAIAIESEVIAKFFKELCSAQG